MSRMPQRRRTSAVSSPTLAAAHMASMDVSSPCLASAWARRRRNLFAIFSYEQQQVWRRGRGKDVHASDTTPPSR